MNKGASSTQVLNESLQDLAQMFNAPSAWLFLCNPTEDIDLLSSYNLPLFLLENSTAFDDEARACLEIHQKDEPKLAQVISAAGLAQANPLDTNGLTHYLSIPLINHQQIIGVLNLAYSQAPQISQTEQQALAMLGQDVGILLEIFHLQEEAQVYATQNAFMVLIARTMSERLDLNAILALSLEQAVPLLNASGGDIWLLSADEQWLELASSLSNISSNPPITRRAKGQGLIGWVAEQGQPLHINQNLVDDSRFDPRVDRQKDIATSSLLAVPLRHREETIGVIAIYNKRGTPFANPDTVLLRGIASLTASAIANAQLLQELRDYADQPRVLY
jgi:GAF domain-containing protein